MGTRYEDQPPEHWAGPESLDPTPVWKQYLLVALFLVVALVLVVVVAYGALAVELATPPAVVLGGRVVLAAGDVPAVGAPGRRFGPPLVDREHAFFLVQPRQGTIVAIRAAQITDDARPVVAVDDASGAPARYDRYLVSIEGAKVVVNISRVISGTEKVPAPTDPTFR
ncbi:MAG TPA: hypothetical protein VF998_09305 [Candidatus Limnocylindria bacterium]